MLFAKLFVNPRSVVEKEMKSILKSVDVGDVYRMLPESIQLHLQKDKVNRLISQKQSNLFYEFLFESCTRKGEFLRFSVRLQGPLGISINKDYVFTTDDILFVWYEQRGDSYHEKVENKKQWITQFLALILGYSYQKWCVESGYHNPSKEELALFAKKHEYQKSEDRIEIREGLTEWWRFEQACKDATSYFFEMMDALLQQMNDVTEQSLVEQKAILYNKLIV
ncbi:MAG: hypothetical protein ACRCWQ_14155 [Bacilli bacterium]